MGPYLPLLRCRFRCRSKHSRADTYQWSDSVCPTGTRIYRDCKDFALTLSIVSVGQCESIAGIALLQSHSDPFGGLRCNNHTRRCHPGTRGFSSHSFAPKDDVRVRAYPTRGFPASSLTRPVLFFLLSWATVTFPSHRQTGFG